jgi:excisionase family DNA binding protein
MTQLSFIQPTTPSVMNVEEVALYLRVAPATIYRLAQQGKIPGGKVGRAWRFRRETIDRWLAEQSATAERDEAERS